MTHGTYSSFIKGCLCSRCWKASESVDRVRKEWLTNKGNRTHHPAPARDFAGLTHGKRGTYVMGCRCSKCKEADSIYNREYRARRPK